MRLLTPPSDLVAPCPVPEPGPLKSNADLRDWTIDLIRELRECDGEKAALRAWKNRTEED